MNCWPIAPARKPTTDLASAPMPMTPLDKASWMKPARLPANMPVAGPLVSATYTTTTSTRSTAAVPLTRKRARVVCNASARAIAMTTATAFTPASARPRYGVAGAPSSAGAGGASTISTASSDVKSTAGRTMIAVNTPCPRSTDSI